MIKLKILSRFNIISLIILITASIYTLYTILTNNYTTKYNTNTNEVIGYINDLNIDGNKISMVLIGKEKILINYYLNDYLELEQIKNNYQLGDYIKASGSISIPMSNTTYNLFNYRKYLLSQKIYWVLKADKITKISDNHNILYQTKNLLIKNIESININKGYFYAFILGDSSIIDNEIMTEYRNNGITHLFAISGMQVLLLALIIKKLCKYIIPNEKIVFIFIILFLLFYAFITNFPPSIMRAIILYIALTVNKLYRLKINEKYAFLLVFSLFLIYNPYFLYNLGFLFSFSICFYLLLFKDYINNYKHYFSKLFITSFIAFIVSIPIIIDNFYEINILTPLLNLLFIPLISLIIYPLTIITFIFPFLNFILTFFLNNLELLSKILNNIDISHITLAKPSIPIIIVYYFLITISLYQMKNHQYLFLYLIIGVFIIHYHITYFYVYPSITFIDIGQGDATLIRLPHNKGNILVDTGGIITFNNEDWQQRKRPYSTTIDTIIPYLKSLGINHLDYLILTHGDYDHIGETNNLINNFIVNNIIFNSGHNNDIENNIIKLVKEKRIDYYFFNTNDLNINNYLFKFLNVKNTKDENKDSLIILTELNNKHIILMGDATKEEEKSLINVYNFPKVDILKVGHHGSNTSTSDILIKNTNPLLAIISAGRNNRFHHPHQETLDILSDNDIKTYVTSINGSITIILKNKLEIYTCL